MKLFFFLTNFTSRFSLTDKSQITQLQLIERNCSAGIKPRTLACIEEIINLTIQEACQTPITHELIYEHALIFIYTISNQIYKIPVMQPAKQNYLQKE